MNGNPVYLPQPVWHRDPVGLRALQGVGFCLFMAGVFGLNKLLEFMMGGW